MTTSGSFNSKSPTIKRILREAAELSTLPTTDYIASPLDSNLFEWHFTLRGPPGTPYSAGLYHGRIVLPPSYPLRPPSFRFLTPSGRFEPNREICLSISGHHEESWQPAWGIRTALVAIRAFMEGDARGQVGGVDASKEVRERLARESRGWRCNGCGKTCAEVVAEKEKEQEGTENNVEDKVPEGLKLGFRDEMQGKKEEEKRRAQERVVEAAEGVVAREVVGAGELTVAAPPPAEVVDTTARPTRTVPVQVAGSGTGMERREADGRILNRLDAAIAVFASALAYMIVRKLASWV